MTEPLLHQFDVEKVCGCARQCDCAYLAAQERDLQVSESMPEWTDEEIREEVRAMIEAGNDD